MAQIATTSDVCLRCSSPAVISNSEKKIANWLLPYADKKKVGAPSVKAHLSLRKNGSGIRSFMTMGGVLYTKLVVHRQCVCSAGSLDRLAYDAWLVFLRDIHVFGLEQKSIDSIIGYSWVVGVLSSGLLLVIIHGGFVCCFVGRMMMIIG